MDAQCCMDLSTSYFALQERVGLVSESGAKLNVYLLVKQCATEKLGKVTSSDVMEACPTIGRSAVLALMKNC